MMASPALGPAEALPAPDLDVVLACARMLQQQTLAGHLQPSLRGKYIALVRTDGDGGPGALLERAATELGATVAQVRPFHDGPPPTSAEIQHIAWLIGRLYDAIEWPHAGAGLMEGLREAAGIPVYDGLASDAHPTAHLANLLDLASPLADRRRFVVQAVLLATIV